MAVPNAFQPGNVGVHHYAFDGSIAVNRGDMMFHDTNDVKPMSSYTWDTDEATTQTAAGPKFAGLADKGRLAADTVAETDFPVCPDVICDMDCVSATFEVGDPVTVAKQSGNALENQKVKKISSPASTPYQAIGYAVRRYGSATTRGRFRLISNVTPNHNINRTAAYTDNT